MIRSSLNLLLRIVRPLQTDPHYHRGSHRGQTIAIQAPQAAVAVLHNDGLPFYQEFDLPIKAVLTETSYVKRLDENVVNGSCRIG
jgi:hypothetical protein